MSEPLDVKTTGLVGGLAVAVIAGLKWFAKWRTPEDARFDRTQRNDLLVRAKRSEERYDTLEKKYDELFERFEKLSLELLAEKRTCEERLVELEEKLEVFLSAHGVCERMECPSRIEPDASGALRRVLRQGEDATGNHTKKGV